jgi:carboxyl-terminal processing protease
MLNKKFITLGFITTATAISLFFSPSLFAATPPKVIQKPVTEASRLEALAKFTKVLSIVEQYNVDDVTLQELIDKSLQGMMTNLDAHSAFMNKKSFESLKVQTDGEFGGLGITVGMKDGALTVIAPLEGTPADKAGLKDEDIILKINDKSTLSMTIDDAVSVMR